MQDHCVSIQSHFELGLANSYVPLLYSSHNENNLPAKNELSERIAKDLKIRGFKYVGAVTIYSHLQGVGIINDHFKNCFRREEIISKYPPKVID